MNISMTSSWVAALGLTAGSAHALAPSPQPVPQTQRTQVQSGSELVFHQGPGTMKAAHAVRRVQLAGDVLSAYPHFDYVRDIHQGAPLNVALDPVRFPFYVGQTADLYVVASKTIPQWRADQSLTDARGASTPYTVQGGSIQNNIVQVDAGTLNGTTGTQVGMGYDIVLDFDQDGFLTPGDVIDGAQRTPGIWVSRDTTVPGPYSVLETIYTGGTWLGQDLYYPANIDQLSNVPIVIVSHGNGHDYRWYDHIGMHLASYGYVVMSHQNNTGPGTETASTTTLTNTEYLLANLSTIAGGALDGHVDRHNISWIGHSRGGEGVVRAFNRMRRDLWTSVEFDDTDVVFVSSIAPVTFQTAANGDPFDVNYHLFFGASDSDVNGGVGQTFVLPFAFPERSTGNKTTMYIHGMGHGYFHSGSGSCWCTGPNLISKPAAHAMVRGYYLPLVSLYARNDDASRDYLDRLYEDFKPAGVPDGEMIAIQYKDNEATGNYMIDDFQTQTGLNTSSSGQPVTFSVSILTEGQMDDANSLFTHDGSDAFNGSAMWAKPGDDPRGAAFTIGNQDAFYSFQLAANERDLTDDTYFSMRAAQSSRHVLNVAQGTPLDFQVELEDMSGNKSVIDIGNYGRVTQTYPRTGQGAGAGWATEFNTIRIRLDDFTTDGTGNLDLSNIFAVNLLFGPSHGSAQGHFAVDDIEIIR